MPRPPNREPVADRAIGRRTTCRRPARTTVPEAAALPESRTGTRDSRGGRGNHRGQREARQPVPAPTQEYAERDGACDRDHLPHRQELPEADAAQPGQELLRSLVGEQPLDPLAPEVDPDQWQLENEERGKSEETDSEASPGALPQQPQGHDTVLGLEQRSEDQRWTESQGKRE